MKKENKKFDELRRKREAGGRKWYIFLQGKTREEVWVEEIVRNQKTQGKEENTGAVKAFWKDVGGVNEQEVVTIYKVISQVCFNNKHMI